VNTKFVVFSLTETRKNKAMDTDTKNTLKSVAGGGLLDRRLFVKTGSGPRISC